MTIGRHPDSAEAAMSPTLGCVNARVETESVAAEHRSGPFDHVAFGVPGGAVNQEQREADVGAEQFGFVRAGERGFHIILG